MKFSLQATVWAGVLLAIACAAYAINGFNALADIADPVVQAEAKGYAWFWMFLAAVCAGLAALAGWMVRGMRDGP